MYHTEEGQQQCDADQEMAVDGHGSGGSRPDWTEKGEGQGGWRILSFLCFQCWFGLTLEGTQFLPK